MKHSGYFTRALKAADPRFARVFGKMGYNRADLAADDGAATAPVEPQQPDDLGALRDQYQDAVGKRPYHGWDAAELRRRIAEAGKA